MKISRISFSKRKGTVEKGNAIAQWTYSPSGVPISILMGKIAVARHENPQERKR